MNTSHHWTLQETTGAVATDALGTNNGSIGATVTLGVSGPGGSYPTAADFSGGVTDAIVLDDPIHLSRKHAWTIEFWAKQAAANDKGMVLGDRATNRSFVWLASNAGGLRVRPADGDGGGHDLDFTILTATRTQWTHYVLEHDVSGGTPVVRLYIDGLFSESLEAPDGIGLDINSVGGGHSSASFAMQGQLAGVKVDGTTINISTPDKIVLVLGQSNAEGRFVNNQAYSHPTLFASVFEDDHWKELVDEGTNGEVWPLVATRWLANRGESVGFIYAAVGGTGLVDQPEWGPGGATYDAAIAKVVASGAAKIDAILWFQGERDANQGVSREDYVAAMDDLVSRLQADLPGAPPLICGQIDYVGTGVPDEIRNAQLDAWANPHIFPGPVTYDIGPLADGVHFTTDAEANTLADRWWAAIDEVLYDGTHGTPPRVHSATIDGSVITLVFDRDLESAATYDAAAWTFEDNGSEIAVSLATKTGDRTVSLALVGVPSTSSRSLVLGRGGSAQGLSIPRGLGDQPAVPETVTVTLDWLGQSAVSNVRDYILPERTIRTIAIS